MNQHTEQMKANVLECKIGWEHLLYAKLYEFEYFRKNMIADLMVAGLKKDIAAAYVEEKIAEMLPDIRKRLEKPTRRRMG